jgi:hypothetical protein
MFLFVQALSYSFFGSKYIEDLELDLQLGLGYSTAINLQ